MKTKLLLLMICGFMLPSLSYGQAAGSNTDVQYNSSGSFAGNGNFTFNSSGSSAAFTIGNAASIGRAFFVNFSPSNTTATDVQMGDPDLTFNGSILEINDNTQTLYWNQANVNLNGLGYVLPSTQATIGQVLTATSVSDGVATLTWQPGASSTAWLLTGNAGTTYGTNFLGTTDDQGLMFQVNGQIAGRIEDNNYVNGSNQNTSLGFQALGSNTGTTNCAIGYQALYSNSTSSQNNAFGYQALYSNTTSGGVSGNNNAFGYQALYSTTTDFLWGQDNDAFGNLALYHNTTGQDNDAFGFEAMYYNTTGIDNVAIGDYAGSSAGNGSYNIAIGLVTLANNQANYNIAIGLSSLQNNNDGTPNVALGAWSLYSNTIGSSNDALGYRALYSNVSGNESDAFGDSALYNNTASYNNAFGSQVLVNNTSGTPNDAFGYKALNNNGTGTSNNAFGYNALYYNVSGNENDAFGNSALYNNTAGFNDAFGYKALFNNTSGTPNDAFGYKALYSSQSDSDEAFGFMALYSNQSGIACNAFGSEALYNNTSSYNNAFGQEALYTNTTGDLNTAFGSYALEFNLSGYENAAFGDGALGYNSSGGQNVGMGFFAGANTKEGDNTFIGFEAGYTNGTGGNKNTCIGSGADVYSAGLTHATAIGYNAVVTNSEAMEFGTCDITFTGVNGASWTSGEAFVVGCNSSNGNGAFCSAGGAWTPGSSIKIKDNITVLDGKDILNKIDKLTVERWRYIGTNNEYHIGPFAEQFYGFFHTGVGTDSLHISCIDPSGVALIGIQQLSKNQNSEDSTIAQQQQQIDSLAKQNSYGQQIAAQTQQISNQQKQIDSLTKQSSNQQSEIDQLNTMVSKLDIALSECCTNYQSTTTGSSQTGNATNDAPYLNQNFPNPFSQNTTISCYVPTTAQNATIVIYNLNGQMLKSITIPATGYNQVVIAGGSLAAGDYLYTLYVNGQKIDTKKMTLTH
jgi:hypothetical protein